MRQLLISIIVFCLLFSFLRCKKENAPTFINIKVVDKKSKKPVSGVSVELAFTYVTVRQGSQIEHDEVSFYATDSNGEIKNIVINDADYSGYRSEARKSGYVSIMHILGEITRSKVNDVLVEMTPKDGILEVTIDNQTGKYNSVFVLLSNPTIKKDSKGFANSFTLKTQEIKVLQGSNPHVESVAVPSDEFTSIKWTFKPFGSAEPSPKFVDSVLVVPKDTTKYKLIF
jgi:hypothetical protein